MLPDKTAYFVWRSHPSRREAFPQAAVVWMPDGPALATVGPKAGSRPVVYEGRIDDRLVTGMHDKPGPCRAQVKDAVQLAHAAHARRMRDAG